MDDIRGTGVQCYVLANLSAFCTVWDFSWVLLPALVHSCEKPYLNIGNNLHDEWEEGIDEHRLNEGISGYTVPPRNVVRECTIEDSVSECERLGEVSLDEEQDQGSIEELGEENTVRDLCQLL